MGEYADRFHTKLQTDPVVMAAYLTMGGTSMKDALIQASDATLKNQQAQAYQAEIQQKQYMQAAMPQLLQQIDPADPQGSLERLVQQGVPPDDAMKAVKFAVDASQDQQTQQMWNQMFPGSASTGAPSPDAPAGGSGAPQGGGISGLDPTKFAMMGARTGNPAMVAFGQFLQGQGNRGQDIARDTAKTNEGYYADLDNRYAKRIETLSGVIDDYNVSLDLSKNATGASDYQLIKLGVQAFDKRVSAVTDHEFQNMQQNGSMNENMKQIIGKYTVGEKLTQKQRNDIIDGIRDRAEQNRSKINRINEAFSKKAADMGIDFENIRSGYDPGELRPMEDAGGVDVQASLSNARKAIQANPNAREAIIKRLVENNIDPSGL